MRLNVQAWSNIQKHQEQNRCPHPPPWKNDREGVLQYYILLNEASGLPPENIGNHTSNKRVA